MCSIAISYRAVVSLLNYSLVNDAPPTFLSSLCLRVPDFNERQRVFRSVSSDFISVISLTNPRIRLHFVESLAFAVPVALRAGPCTAGDRRIRILLLERCLRAARSPLLISVSLYPHAAGMLDRVVYALQKGSAEISAVLFSLTAMLVLREGFLFRLPRFSIEVACECSGIRSSIALLCLRFWWSLLPAQILEAGGLRPGRLCGHDHQERHPTCCYPDRAGQLRRSGIPLRRTCTAKAESYSS